MENSETYQRINSQEELDALLNEYAGMLIDCFVLLNGGIRSSKGLSFDEDDNYEVYNDIDGSEELIPHNELMNSFIGEAISKGAFYKYPDTTF